MLWYVRHIVVSVDDSNMSYVSQHWQQYVLGVTTLTTICLTSKKTGNNMSCVSQHWQQYKTYCWYCCDAKDIFLSKLWCVRHIVVSDVICKIYYLSQHWQQYVLYITTLTPICLAHHNSDINMSYVSQHWKQYVLHITSLTNILLLALWHARHSVVSVVAHKTYCCQCCDT
jgi:hypothetical protein